MTDALAVDRPDQRAVPYQAAILFETGPGLRDVLLETMTGRARESLGRRALALSSDTLMFASEDQFISFKDSTLDPFVRQKIGSGRLPLRGDASLEDVYAGREAIRFVFSPSEEIRVALAGLHGRMMERLRGNAGHLANGIRRQQRHAPGHLTLTVGREYLPAIPLTAAENDLNWRMEAERREHGALFVHNPGVHKSPIR